MIRTTRRSSGLIRRPSRVAIASAQLVLVKRGALRSRKSNGSPGASRCARATHDAKLKKYERNRENQEGHRQADQPFGQQVEVLRMRFRSLSVAIFGHHFQRYEINHSMGDRFAKVLE